VLPVPPQPQPQPEPELPVEHRLGGQPRQPVGLLRPTIAALVITASDTRPGATITWSATGLPTGLSIAPGTGAITGMPTTTGAYA